MHSRNYQSRKCSALHLLYAGAERAEDPIRPQARRRRRDHLRMSYNKNGRRKLRLQLRTSVDLQKMPTGFHNRARRSSPKSGESRGISHFSKTTFVLH